MHKPSEAALADAPSTIGSISDEPPVECLHRTVSSSRDANAELPNAPGSPDPDATSPRVRYPGRSAWPQFGRWGDRFVKNGAQAARLIRGSSRLPESKLVWVLFPAIPILAVAEPKGS